VSLLLGAPQRTSLLDARTSAPSWPPLYDLTVAAAAAERDPLATPQHTSGMTLERLARALQEP